MVTTRITQKSFTHVLQGLDVVIFGILKTAWSSAIKSYTTKNIKAAFQKTGVWPFSDTVVSLAQMAPSLEHSLHAHSLFTLPSPEACTIKSIPSIPTQGTARASPESVNGEGIEGHVPAFPDSPDGNRALAMGSALVPMSTPQRLTAAFGRTSSASFLFDAAPVESGDNLPPLVFLKRQRMLSTEA